MNLKFIIVLSLILIKFLFVGCASTKLNNFIKNNEPNNTSKIFKKDNAVYFAKLSPLQINFYKWNDKAKDKNQNTIAKLNLQDYLIDINEMNQDIKEYRENFALDELTDSMVATPQEYLANMYNDVFVKVMNGESLHLTKYSPNKYNTSELDINLFDSISFKSKFIISPRDSLRVLVYEPANLELFCEQFLQKYNKAEYFIVIGNFYLTDLFKVKDYWSDPNTGLQWSISTSKGIFIIPKVVIDLKNKHIAGYHIGRSIIFPGTFESIKAELEEAIIIDTEEFNFYF
jgi:hypothetical protein